jgi:hypothetical protein
MSKQMEYMAVISLYPIGTRLRLENDYPGDSHEVYRYINGANGAYMEFRDGARLNLANIDQIREVL